MKNGKLVLPQYNRWSILAAAPKLLRSGVRQRLYAARNQVHNWKHPPDHWSGGCFQLWLMTEFAESVSQNPTGLVAGGPGFAGVADPGWVDPGAVDPPTAVADGFS